MKAFCIVFDILNEEKEEKKAKPEIKDLKLWKQTHYCFPKTQTHPKL